MKHYLSDCFLSIDRNVQEIIDNKGIGFMGRNFVLENMAIALHYVLPNLEEVKKGPYFICLSAVRRFHDLTSRVHARIYLDEDILMLEDLGSTNGTFVDDEKIEPNERRILRTSQEIRLGQLTFRYCIGDDSLVLPSYDLSDERVVRRLGNFLKN